MGIYVAEDQEGVVEAVVEVVDGGDVALLAGAGWGNVYIPDSKVLVVAARDLDSELLQMVVVVEAVGCCKPVEGDTLWDEEGEATAAPSSILPD